MPTSTRRTGPLTALAMIVLYCLALAAPAQAGDEKGKVAPGALLFITEKLSVKLKSDMWRQRIDQPLHKEGRRTNYNTREIAEIRETSRAIILVKEDFLMRDVYLTPGNSPGVSEMNFYGKGHELTAYRVRLLSGRHAGKIGWIYGDHLLKTSGAGAAKRPAGYKITFKSGRTLETQHYRKQGGEILIRRHGGTIGYDQASIESIEPVF